MAAGNEQIGSPGAGTFTQSGGTHTVINAFTLGAGGTYNLTGGVLQLPDIQANGGVFNFSGGTLVTETGQTNFTANQNMTLAGSGNINTSGNAAAFSGNLTGMGGLLVFGGGTLGLAGSNSYSGGTTVSGAGTTILLAGGAPLLNSTLTLATSGNGLALDTSLGASTFSVGGLSGSGSGSLSDINGYSATLSVGGIGANTTFSGALTDGAVNGGSGSPGNLAKVGSGTLVLCGSNSYSGMTTVSGGTLKLDFSQPGRRRRHHQQPGGDLDLGPGGRGPGGPRVEQRGQQPAVQRPDGQPGGVRGGLVFGIVESAGAEPGNDHPQRGRDGRFHTAQRHFVGHQRDRGRRRQQQRHPRRLGDFGRYHVGHGERLGRRRSLHELHFGQFEHGGQQRKLQRLAFRRADHADARPIVQLAPHDRQAWACQ